MSWIKWVVGFLILGIPLFGFGEVGDRIRYLPIQDSGRIKPFDTFSKETLELVYGKKEYNSMPATAVVLTWLLSPSAWEDKKIFEIRNLDILKALGLNKEERYFTGKEIFSASKFSELMQSLQQRRETKEKLTPYYQALQRLENQLIIFREIVSGKLIKVLPPKEGSTWISVADFNETQQKEFMELSKSFVNYISAIGSGDDNFRRAGESFDHRISQFINFARTQNPEMYANEKKINAEVIFNSLHPFRITYIFYLIGAVLLMGVWLFNFNKLIPMAWISIFLGLGMHSVGFALRVFLMERPPVSNMYETVVWMSWGCLLFAMIIEAIYKFRFVLFAGALGSVVALIIADSAPAVLDPSLQPLEPVLRSNYWLIVHVMTITISYAAFFLAFILGDIGLIYTFMNEEKNKEKLKSIVMAIYRAIQIGVVFLAPGIILGGIWADYSWGRFWGWDPKETWALIALLGYLAVLHGRLIGWIRQYGMILSSIVAFNLVIMAWYGVNFVLGAGLHSYGFGAGGIEYVSVFVFAHLGAVIYVTLNRKFKAIS